MQYAIFSLLAFLITSREIAILNIDETPRASKTNYFDGPTTRAADLGYGWNFIPKGVSYIHAPLRGLILS